MRLEIGLFAKWTNELRLVYRSGRYHSTRKLFTMLSSSTRCRVKHYVVVAIMAAAAAAAAARCVHDMFFMTSAACSVRLRNNNNFYRQRKVIFTSWQRRICIVLSRKGALVEYRY